jgi:multiple sugar transport system ATP-binding protein
MASISLRNVSKTYPNEVVAVTDCSLDIADKEFVVLVGPSGCGKSTTLRMIAGLEDLTEGDMYIDGKLVNAVPPKERNIAFVFQNYALYPHMTVFKNMAFALVMSKTPKNEIDRRVREVAKTLDIEHLLGRKPKVLSGGQRQRVALGRAMVRNPVAFLLDEPLSNLDAKLRASMRTELIKLHKQLGATFVYVTHDQTEAMTMGDRIVVMNEGVIQQIDTPQNLYDHPNNAFVAGFIGIPQMNFLETTLRKDGDGYFLESGEDRFLIPSDRVHGGLAGYIDSPVVLGVRPEDIHDDPAYVAANPGSAIGATVDLSEPMGSEVHLYLKYGDVDLIARVPPTTASRTGTDIRISFDMGRIHLFDADTTAAIPFPDTNAKAAMPPTDADGKAAMPPTDDDGKAAIPPTDDDATAAIPPTDDDATAAIPFPDEAV